MIDERDDLDEQGCLTAHHLTLVHFYGTMFLTGITEDIVLVSHLYSNSLYHKEGKRRMSSQETKVRATNISYKEARRCIDDFIKSNEKLRQLEMLHTLIESSKENERYRYKGFLPTVGDTKMLQAVNRITNVHNGKIILKQEQIINLLLKKID